MKRFYEWLKVDADRAAFWLSLVLVVLVVIIVKMQGDY